MFSLVECRSGPVRTADTGAGHGRNFDLAIIAAGVVVWSVALAMAAEGWSIMVMYREPRGRTCFVRGCNPIKGPVAARAAFAHLERMSSLSLSRKTRRERWELRSVKRSFTDKVPEQQEAMYRDAGITVLHGTARFTGANEFDVAEERITATYIVIGTGARLVPPNISGKEHLVDHKQFMDFTALPRQNAEGPALTPVASKDEEVIVSGVEGQPAAPDQAEVRSGAFTSPPIASNGLPEAAARKACRAVRLGGGVASDRVTARQATAPGYAYKAITDEGSGRIHAEEVTNLFAPTTRKGMTAREQSSVTSACPTARSDLS